MSDQNIHLYERITKILAKLTDDVEAELEMRLQVLDTRLADTTSRLERMVPHVDDLRDGLSQVKRTVSEVIARRAEVFDQPPKRHSSTKFMLGYSGNG